MTEIALIAKISVSAGKRGEAIEAFAPLLEHSAQESGTLSYLLHEDSTDPDLLWMYEVYTDEAARDIHRGSNVMKVAGRALGSLLARPPEITVLRPIGGHGR